MADAFVEFLRREASRTKVRRIGSALYIIEGERTERRYRLPTDFIDAILLRREPGEHVVVEKGLIRELRYRIDELESEVKRLRLRSRVLEALLATCIVALILSLFR
ncbi:MAG: hypothetical protein DRJ96_00065 [Thermoprotei archaeon]|nr:MAG: hypothetical protein DRJ67_05840 [Thermoprotei archaeon]RLE98766.1 MAG: hypothetical protein DRJ96_00065 [Thermoprotei archaeon]